MSSRRRGNGRPQRGGMRNHGGGRGQGRGQGNYQFNPSQNQNFSDPNAIDYQKLQNQEAELQLENMKIDDVFTLYPLARKKQNYPSRKEAAKDAREWKEKQAGLGDIVNLKYNIMAAIQTSCGAVFDQFLEKHNADIKSIRQDMGKIRESVKKLKNTQAQDDKSKKEILICKQWWGEEAEKDTNEMRRLAAELLTPYSVRTKLETKHISYVEPMGDCKENRRYRCILWSESWRDEIVQEALSQGAQDIVKKGRTVAERVRDYNVFLVNQAQKFWNFNSGGEEWAIVVRNTDEDRRTVPFLLEKYPKTDPKVAEIEAKAKAKKLPIPPTTLTEDAQSFIHWS